jgi:hypothetical protein
VKLRRVKTSESGTSWMRRIHTDRICGSRHEISHDLGGGIVFTEIPRCLRLPGHKGAHADRLYDPVEWWDDEGDLSGEPADNLPFESPDPYGVS